jgi:hypothetical protein
VEEEDEDGDNNNIEALFGTDDNMDMPATTKE